ncbi:MAG: alpha/beta fold hydrolase [Caldimonas sp.]
MHAYRSPRWLPGGHAQTIWPVLFSRRFRGPPPHFRRERWATPDADFVDVDWLGEQRSAPLLVLFHGLEGSSRSHYAQAFAAEAARRAWRFAVPHFRGCSGEINLAPRAYHSGDFAEVGWMLERFRALHDGPVLAVGVSLGGNALLRFAEEAGESASRSLRALAAVSAPLDLAAGGRAIGRGFGRQVYTRMFMRTMKRKAFVKLAQYPGLFDASRMRAAADLRDFDDIFTGPLHGFAGADDYYARASAGSRLGLIRIPALVINARNDPFLAASALPRPGDVGDCVTLWQPAHGGHVGFAGGAWPGHLRTVPEEVAGWLGERL